MWLLAASFSIRAIKGTAIECRKKPKCLTARKTMTFLATFTGSMRRGLLRGDRRRELSDRCGEGSSADASPRRYHLDNLGSHRGKAVR